MQNIRPLATVILSACVFKLCHNYHARVQDFYQGVGGPGLTSRKQSGQRFFIVFSLFYSLQRGSTGFIAGKTTILQGSRGGPTNSGGGGGSNFFQGCLNANFYRNP